MLSLSHIVEKPNFEPMQICGLFCRVFAIAEKLQENIHLKQIAVS